MTRSLQLGLMPIPADLLLDGPAALRLTLRANLVQTAASPVYIGPRSALLPVIEQHLAYGSAMQWVLPVVILFTIALSVLLIFFSREPLKYVLLISAIGLQLFVETDWLVTYGPRVEQFVPLVGALVNLLVACSIAVWTHASRRRWRLLTGFGLPMLGVFALLSATGMLQSSIGGIFIGIIYPVWLFLLQIFNWHAILRSNEAPTIFRSGALATFMLTVSGLTAYALLLGFHPGIVLTFFLSNWANVASGLGLLVLAVGALVFETLNYRKQRKQLGALEVIAAGHHSLLDEQGRALQRQIEHAAVLEERQRFLADMHDGLGGQLLTLMLRLRRTQGASAKLADDVQAIIADLRLMTSTIGEDGVSFAAALARQYLQSVARASAAGVKLLWTVELSPDSNPAPRDALDCLRLLDEAVTNAIRHAGARTVSVGITDRDGFSIRVVDDGCGFDPERVTAGAGLRNIRQRSTRLKGQVSFKRHPSGRGTIVELRTSSALLVSRSG